MAGSATTVTVPNCSSSAHLITNTATPLVSSSCVSATPPVATPTVTAAHPVTPAVPGSCSCVSAIPPVVTPTGTAVPVTPAVTVPGSCSRVSANSSVATPTGTAAHPATPAVAVLGSCSSVSVIPPVASLQCMYNSFLVRDRSSWTSQLTEELQLGKISRFFDQSPLVTHSVIVYGDLTWATFVHGHNMSGNPYFSSIPHTIDYNSLLYLLLLLDELNVCPGNPYQFCVHGGSMQEYFLCNQFRYQGLYLDKFPVRFNGSLYQATVRTLSCSLVVTSGKCDSCKSYHPSLRAKYSRWLKKASSPAKYANNRYLTTPQRQKKMKVLKQRVYSAERELHRVHERINKSTESKGVVLDDSLSDDLTAIMEESTSYVHEYFPEGSSVVCFGTNSSKLPRPRICGR